MIGDMMVFKFYHKVLTINQSIMMDFEIVTF